MTTTWRPRLSTQREEDERTPVGTSPLRTPGTAPPAPPRVPTTTGTTWQPQLGVAGGSATARQPVGASPIGTPGIQRQSAHTPRALEWANRGLRFVSGVLSPLTAPQDILFTTVHGLADPNTSVWENWQRMEWANYTPWTPSPARVVSGNQLLESLGVEDEGARRYAGFMADMFFDPLIFGSALRLTARVAGTSQAATNMRRAADAMDTVAQSAMLIGGVPTARVARAGQQAYRAAAPAAVQQHVTRSLESLTPMFRAVLDAPIPLTRGRVTLGSTFVVDASRAPEAVERMSRVRGLATDVQQDVAERIGQILAVTGDQRAAKWMRDMMNSHSIHYEIPAIFNRYPADVSEALIKAIYGTGRQVSPARFGGVVEGLGGDAGRFLGEVQDVLRAARTGPFEQQARFQPRLLAREEAGLRTLAQRRNLDPEGVVNSFRYGLQKALEADSLIGYHASGMGILRDVFWERITRAGATADQARDAWMTMLRQGMLGNFDDWLRQPVLRPAARAAPAQPARAGAGAYSVAQELQGFGLSPHRSWRQPARPAVAQRTAPATPAGPTGADLFAQYGDAFNLGVRSLLENIPQGHLRRAYGIFQDGATFERFQRAIEDGLLIPTKIIDEGTVLQRLSQQQPEMTRLFQNYVRSVTPAGSRVATGPTRQMTNVVSTDNMMRFMHEQGRSRADIEGFMKALLSEANPQIADLVRDMRFYWDRHVGTGAFGRAAGGVEGGGAFAARRSLDEDALATLLELGDVATSLREGAVAVGRSINVRTGVAEIMRLAERSQMIQRTVRDAPAPRNWVPIPVDKAPQILAPWAGYTMHPILAREVQTLMARANSGGGFASAWGRVRSMITGGFLANPATTTTNIVGSFMTGYQLGLPIVPFVRNTIGVLQDIKKMGRNLPEYRAMGDLLEGALTSADLLRRMTLPTTRQLTARNIGERVSQLGESFYNTYQNAILRPRGPGGSLSYVGLRVFEMSESALRLGAYRTAVQMGKSADEARKLARFALFDYAAQPEFVRLMKDTGLLAFPAFPYFMMGRAITSSLTYPGRMAALDRAPGAIWELMIPDEDERVAMYAAIDDWMVTGKYIPYRGGDGRYSFLPFNQLLPTNTLTTDNFIDSMATLGILGPLVDVVSALVGTWGDDTLDAGEARLTGRFGRRVFQAESDTPQRIQETMQFIHNSFAPGWARKLFRFPESRLAEPTGLAPELARAARQGFTAGPELGERMYSVSELLRRRPDRDFIDELVTFGIRTTRPVQAGGPVGGAERHLESAYRTLMSKVSALQRQLAVASEAGRVDTVARLNLRIGQLITEFEERWGPVQDIVRATPSVLGR